MPLAVEEMGRSDAVDALHDRTVANTSSGDRYDVWAGTGKVILSAQDTDAREEYDDYGQFRWALKSGEYYAPDAERPSVHELVDTIVDAQRGDA